MSGNTFGRLFTVTSFGESHGPALGCIVDGCPPGLALTEADLQAMSTGAAPAPRSSSASVAKPMRCAFSPGVFEGRTTGTPIGLLIENTDARSRDYEKIKDRFRPGHADYTYQQKYGFRDYRGGGRSRRARRSCAWRPGRSPASTWRSAWASHHGYVSQVGPLTLEPVNPAVRL